MINFQILLVINYILSFLAIFGMVFIERKKPIRIVAWSFTIIILPFAGLLLYILIGYGLGISTKRMLKKCELSNSKYNDSLKKQYKLLKTDSETFDDEQEYKELILLNMKNANSIFTRDNDIKYYSFGSEMIEDLKSDLLKAQKTINIAFYIFSNDKISKEIRDILIQKQAEGVKVKLLYDAIGSITTHKWQFKKLKKLGGEVQEFFPAFLGIKLFNLKANYRNHRKIVVIDGKIGYIGGLNIRDDHMNLKKRVSPWKDAHIKVVGSSVASLQNIFLSDWQFACKKPKPDSEYLTNEYFSQEKNSGKSCVQIIPSSPTESYNKSIEQMMIKMIYDAKQTITIETPYFILDDEFKMAIKMAVNSGVKVKIVIPKKPDKKLVYYATLSHIREMLELGVEVYLYNGFLHAKTLCVDEKILTLGSCNIDIRSFALNFEANAIIYGYDAISPYLKISEQTLSESDKLDKMYFEKMSTFRKMLISISKLFSAIL